MKCPPVHHVPRHGVPPCDVSPHGCVAVVLVEEVIPSLVVERPVGVVHPILARLEVVRRAVRLIDVGRRRGALDALDAELVPILVGGFDGGKQRRQKNHGAREQHDSVLRSHCGVKGLFHSCVNVPMVRIHSLEFEPAINTCGKYMCFCRLQLCQNGIGQE